MKQFKVGDKVLVVRPHHSREGGMINVDLPSTVWNNTWNKRGMNVVVNNGVVYVISHITQQGVYFENWQNHFDFHYGFPSISLKHAASKRIV